MIETPSGMLNAVGLQNKGVDYFIDTIYPRIKDCGSEIIVNVSGANIDDYTEVAAGSPPLTASTPSRSTFPAPTSNKGAWHSAPHATARLR